MKYLMPRKTFKPLKNKITKLRNRHFLIIDILVFLLTPIFALQLRLDGAFGLQDYAIPLLLATTLFLLIKITVFIKFGFYKHCWHYASIDELKQTAILIITSTILQTLVFIALHSLNITSINELPQSIPILDGLISLITVGSLRFIVRLVERENQRRNKFYGCDRVLIVGADNTGVSLVENMQRNPQLGFYPVAFIDDDPEKLNLRIRGIPILGNRYRIPEVIRNFKVNRVIIAIASDSGSKCGEIADICQTTGVKTITLPGIQELLNGRAHLKDLKDIKVEDLLRRNSIQTDVTKITKFLRGKKVLITGAGGSIGSEICRQVLNCKPKEIVLVGHGENSIFNVEQNLKQILQILEHEGKTSGYTPRLTTFIADLRFPERLEQVFAQFQPEVIFHAAAHKHVPLMEGNVPEAITNNVFGTKNLLDLALKYDVSNFVMISTDKAVNPTNVMGASKRVAEMIVLQAAQKTGKPYVVVRFGNVLGSRGSVIPTFKQQIAAGGPVTVTHPEICRYFMTIPEAVQLTLQASVISRGGEVVMLNMGEPVKIVDLAKDLISLSGFEVGKDIEIKFTGLRPGEKLYEELFIAGEEYEPTEHNKLFIAKNASQNIALNLNTALESLFQAAINNDSNLIMFLLEQLVHGYKPNYQSNSVQNITEKKRATQATPISSQTAASFYPKYEDLQRALTHDEFTIHYQPIMHLGSDQPSAVEALLRWKHPIHGLIPAKKFVQVAEQTGLIIPIGWWVLLTVCQQIQVWRNQQPQLKNIIVNINLSCQQLLQSDCIEQINSIFQQVNIDTSSLRLEISESFIQENYDTANVVLSKLHNSGVKLQMDNCGNTNSPFLDNLDELPNSLYQRFDSFKIASSLVHQIETNPKTVAAIKRFVQIAYNHGVELIATGVETLRQMEELKALKCPYAQGYFFSHPVAGEKLKAVIDDY